MIKLKNKLYIIKVLVVMVCFLLAPHKILSSNSKEESKGCSSYDYDDGFIFTADWFSHNIPVWQRILNEIKNKKNNILEIGCFEGRATVWMIRNLLLHPESTITVVDSFAMGSEKNF